MSKRGTKMGGILNELNAVGLLLFLYENKQALATDLLNVSGNYTKLKSMAETMREKGLVEIEIDYEPRITYHYRLTPKGMIVAKLLSEADSIIRE